MSAAAGRAKHWGRRHPGGTVRGDAGASQFGTTSDAWGTSLQAPHQADLIRTLEYRGFSIATRTFEVRGSGRWAIGVVIRRWGSLRAFDSPATAASEDGADAMSEAFARLLIDQHPHATSLADLQSDEGPGLHR